MIWSGNGSGCSSRSGPNLFGGDLTRVRPGILEEYNVNKEELIDGIIKTLQTEFQGRDSVVTERDREFLKNSTVTWLENKLRGLQEQVVAKRHQQQIMSTPQPVTHEDVQRAIRQAEQETAKVREQAEERLLQIQATRAAESVWFQWERQQATEPQRKAQLDLDRQTFADAAKALRTFGVNEANLNVTLQTIGPGVSIYQIREMLAANGATLSPATQRELDQWRAEDIEAHNAAIVNADHEELRARVRQEAVDSRAANPCNRPKQTANWQAARRNVTAISGFPSLPDTWQGRQLDAAFIRGCDVPTHKLLARRFGSAQLEARLRGVA